MVFANNNISTGGGFLSLHVPIWIYYHAAYKFHIHVKYNIGIILLAGFEVDPAIVVMIDGDD
jgi:hypothetical protein